MDDQVRIGVETAGVNREGSSIRERRLLHDRNIYFFFKSFTTMKDVNFHNKRALSQGHLYQYAGCVGQHLEFFHRPEALTLDSFKCEPEFNWAREIDLAVASEQAADKEGIPYFISVKIGSLPWLRPEKLKAGDLYLVDFLDEDNAYVKYIPKKP